MNAVQQSSAAAPALPPPASDETRAQWVAAGERDEGDPAVLAHAADTARHRLGATADDCPFGDAAPKARDRWLWMFGRSRSPAGRDLWNWADK